MIKRSERILTTAFVLWLIALLPRVVGLGGFLTIDEIKWIEGAGQFVLALQSGDLAKTYWHFFPGITITWGEALFLALGSLISGYNLSEYASTLINDPAHSIWFFRLPGALLTSIFGTGIYLLTRHWLGQWGASLAGALVGLDPFLLAHSRIVNGDAGVAGFMLLSWLAFIASWPHSPIGMIILSGLLGGLALLTKLPSPLIIPFIILLAFIGWWQARRTTINSPHFLPNSALTESSDNVLRLNLMRGAFGVRTMGIWLL
ncbi:MAG: glycosyltransferase family 39 protein, partial [Candidatus Methanomethylicaceae archaeon]